MYTEHMFSEEELEEIREQFYYVDRDYRGRERIFFDNAGGSLRLKKAEESFHQIDSMPDASEHSNELALELAALEERGREDLKKVVFNAKSGTIYPSFTASQIAMEVVRVILENAEGTNVVITKLEHPSVYDAASLYAGKHGMELRVADVNRQTGGVDAQAVADLVDEGTALLCCMAASNISGYIYETAKICGMARKKNPSVYIYVDAVQHAPHASLDPETWGADACSFAPYKFFGVRGFGTAWLSDRVSTFTHHRLLGKAEDDWEIGSPATGHYASLIRIVDYVAGLGAKEAPGEKNRRKLFEAGMRRVADHERGLLWMMLEGVDGEPGMRHIPGVKVQMDGKDLCTRDLILGVEFENLPCKKAVAEYEKRGVITFERSLDSMFSKRMVEAFGSAGMVRLSPLHVNTPAEIARFLRVTQELAVL
ncbi:MAG: aminotransferase class V-fold PLP-dependent enzyme [Eubacteriales bacterium]|nr:aminotransferase class V-fold PLP-dependent enzyme [Eubacteriales bacterium]